MRVNILSFYIKRLFCTDKQFLDELHRITKLYPTNEDLYKLAFVHRSASLKLEDGTVINNERLEFLGDAVLELMSSQFFYNAYPDMNEGYLTRLRSSMVCEQALAFCAREFDLPKYIL